MIRQNGKKLRRRGIRLLIAVLSLCLVATMTPLVSFADGAGWSDSIYVLGHQVTSENCNDVLGDGGSVKYDKDTRTLTLTNAELDLANYHSEFTEFNSVSGIDIGPGNVVGTKIVLNGMNEIVTDATTFPEGVEYVYGITTTDELTISGPGELSIDYFSTDCPAIEKWYGIESTRKLTIEDCAVGASMNGSGDSCGILTMWKGFELKNGHVTAMVTGGNGTAVYDSSYAKSMIDGNSTLRLYSDNCTYQYSKLADSVVELGALVNKEMDFEGATRWDQKTRLSEYKYVFFPYIGQRWGDSVYVLGREITQDNCWDVLGDGHVSYDFDKKVLTLDNAKLDLTAYYMDPSVENNYVSGITSWDDISIVLEGKNLIYSKTPEYAADKEYVYGINANGELMLTGDGTLDININTGKDGLRYYGIDSEREMTVSAFTTVNVEMDGSGDSTGIDANWNGMTLVTGSKVTSNINGGNGYAVCDTSFGDSVFEEGAMLQMTSDSQAFNYIMLNDSFTKAGALVNSDPTPAGAAAWDKTTRLSNYKFVKFPEKSQRAKKANTLAVKGKTVNLKYSDLKKKAQTIKASKAYKFTNKGQGTKTYAKVKGNKKITVNKKTGAITVKKGLAKNKYTVKVKVKAAGNANYKAGSKTVSVVIIIK